MLNDSGAISAGVYFGKHKAGFKVPPKIVGRGIFGAPYELIACSS
jgi:hypothetical protein